MKFQIQPSNTESATDKLAQQAKCYSVMARVEDVLTTKHLILYRAPVKNQLAATVLFPRLTELASSARTTRE